MERIERIKLIRYFEIVRIEHSNYYQLIFNNEQFPIQLSVDSIQVLPARLLGIPYYIYLRILRDECKAIITHNNEVEVKLVPNPATKRLVFILNKALQAALMYYTYPNLENMVVAEKEKIAQEKFEELQKNGGTFN